MLTWKLPTNSNGNSSRKCTRNSSSCFSVNFNNSSSGYLELLYEFNQVFFKELRKTFLLKLHYEFLPQYLQEFRRKLFHEFPWEFLKKFHPEIYVKLHGNFTYFVGIF